MAKLKSIYSHPYFWLFALVLVAYWPIVFQQIVIPHDMVNCWIPWRHYISDTIQNGQFPWWNPYQQMGYPIHADLQGPTWHIESLLASMVGRQGPIYIQYILLAYIYIGGLGIYKLASLFSEKKWILFLSAATYICAGYFTNHSMHMFSIISAAFVPHIIYHFIRMCKGDAWAHAWLAAVFVFFNLTGGNQTFTILTFYLLLLIFIHTVIRLRGKEKKAKLAFLKVSAIFGGATALMGAVIFTTYSQFKPYLSRLSNLEYEAATLFPFTPQASLSYLNPMANMNEHEWMGTDGTMSNAYFGLLFLLLFFISLFRKKSSVEKIFLGFGLFALLASFGSQTLAYEYIFNYIPLLDKFRFPAYYNFFFMLSALALGVKTLEQIFYADGLEKKALWTGVGLGAVVLASTIAGVALLSDVNIFSSSTNIFGLYRHTDLAQSLFFYGMLQLVVVSIIIVALRKKNKKLLVIVILCDCIISVQPQLLNFGANGVKPYQIEQSLSSYNLDELPRHFPAKDNLFSSRTIPYLWQNVNHLDKRVGYDGFNSNYFSSLWDLVANRPHQSDLLFSNPYVFLSNNLLTEEAYQADNNLMMQNTTLISASDKTDFEHIVQDTLIKGYVETTQFENDDMRFLCKTEAPYSLNLLQSHYPGWKVYLDGEETELYITNSLFMSVIVPAGEHNVVFEYNNTAVKLAAVISYGAFLIVMGLISFYYIKKKKSNLVIVIMGWTIPLIIVVQYLI